VESSEEELEWMDRLVKLGLAVQRHLRGVLATGDRAMAQPVMEGAGDTIYGIDRQVEPIIERAVDGWPGRCKPLILIAEGMGSDGERRYGPGGHGTRYRVIVDPIDGTRGLMYDKRSAWFLAGVACDLGPETSLADVFAAAMVELPTTKQAFGDVFIAGRQHATRGFRARLGGRNRHELSLRPSAAATLKDGFAQVSNFFPGTKVLAAQLMERIVLRTLGQVRPGRADVFDDQYVSTGGQLVELIVGHDRFCCDLRPLFYDILDRTNVGPVPRGIECHPYDLAGILVARQAGVILTNGFGAPLNGPLDVHHGMHWCGYANETLRRLIEPVILEWLQENGRAADR
jgi:hypothetical protein